MTFNNRVRSKSTLGQRLLQSVNLRPGEGERTFLMFSFYTLTSVGLLWLEQTTIALFLEGFGAEGLPIIYIASAVMGSGLGVLYSWLQNHLPLRKVFFVIALLMALPLLLFRVGLEIDYFNGAIALATVFMMRLWMDAEEILNDLNSQVAANQLFNIREIKRTYPIISSGLLVGDVISGFSLYFLVGFLGIENIIIMASAMILVGGLTLLYLTQRYKKVFPDTPVKEIEELESHFNLRRLKGTLGRYVIPLFAFFILGEVLFLVLEFQYLGELEQVYPDTTEIAGFLGMFSGVLGICELVTQLFVSNRALERLGVFTPAMLLPISLSIMGFLTIVFDVGGWEAWGLSSVQIMFFGAIVLKFIDELLRYTLIAGIEPILFQPIPEQMRGSIQSLVQGVAEPLAAGVTGAGILGVIWLIGKIFPQNMAKSGSTIQGGVFLGFIVVFSLCWTISALLLRLGYVNLLVQGAEQGRLGFANVDLKAFKRKVVETLERTNNESDQRSCIQLLAKIDLPGLGEAIAPRLIHLSPALQAQSLRAMLKYPNPDYAPDVNKLMEQDLTLEVKALVLRYLWLSQPQLDVQPLQRYLGSTVDPVVRGTAAGLIFSRGDSGQRQLAKGILQKMLLGSQEQGRLISAQALESANDEEMMHTYLPKLLKDESPRVRRAAIEVIGAKHLQDFYPSLLKGLYYKSTRETALQALVSLGNEALPLLENLAMDVRKPDFVRLQAWQGMGAIGTSQSLNSLAKQLLSSWGLARRNLLRVLLKLPAEAGIEAVLENLGCSIITTMVEQEMLLLAQVCAGVVDISRQPIQEPEGQLLTSALQDLQGDIIERCFLLMKLLYPNRAIQAAMLNLNSESDKSIAQGLEILDNVLDIPQKQIFINVLEHKATEDKLGVLSEIATYEPMAAQERLQVLFTLRHFLSDWALACCFHFARQIRIKVQKRVIMSCLRHPSSFVREAVFAYLQEASPRTCRELLPMLKNDPDPIMAAQVESAMSYYSPVS